MENKYYVEIGENDPYILELIRNDSVKEFISYVNNSNLPLWSTANFKSKKDNISLIEYDAFFCAIQVFQYLSINEVKLSKIMALFYIYSKKIT